MAGWISSKLKVAENLLQQIDQQAAESLRKNESPSLSPDRHHIDDEAPRNVAPSPPAVPLKLQISRKPSPLVRPKDSRRSLREPSASAQGKAPDAAKRGPVRPAAKAEDDWTELLGAVPAKNRSVGVSLERQRSGRRLGAAEKRSGASVGEGSSRKLGPPVADVKDSGEGATRDRVKIADKEVGGGGLGEAERVAEVTSVDCDAGRTGGVKEPWDGNAVAIEVVDSKGEVDDAGSEIIKSEEIRRSSTTSGNSAPYGQSPSSEDSDSDSESESESDDDSENEREKRRMIAEKAAAMAAEAIKERENMVARLEGEKQSLEKILEERKKQQAEEALEMQTSMMETMEAAELEKQRHNSTRMQALARVAALESRNADLAKSLASAQWNLETEVSRVSDLQQQIEVKKLAQEGLKRKMRKLQSSSSLKKNLSEGIEHERGILEAEYSFLCEKVLQLKEKAKKIEDSIEVTKKEMVARTEVEVELKGRLDQLTDRIIQKQTQVESLSVEKAMLLFKIESISRYLQDGGISSSSDGVAINLGTSSARIDVEVGSWDPSYRSSAAKFARIRAAESHLMSFIKQMDTLFSVGISYLRRNPNARIWSVVYLLLLHIWVFYVFSSHSRPANTGSSGAVFSLEKINKTGP